MRLPTPDPLVPLQTPPTRRGALASLFTAGYALSAGPPAAAAITTDAEGLIEEETHFFGADRHAVPAYIARPDGRGRAPGVIVVNEIFGVHAYIKDVCRRLAKQGYAAMAPDYFDRAGDPAALTDMAAVRPIVEATPQGQVMADTDAAIALLTGSSFARADGVGVTGFCWGGTIAWLAARSQKVKAAVAWYGRLSARKPGEFGYSPDMRAPIGEAAALKAPVLGLYAENDRGIPLSEVEAMRAALAAAGEARSEIVVYPGTEHGFHADYRPAYNAAAAEDGWKRLLAWFAANGLTP